MRIGVRIAGDSLHGVAVAEREICGSVTERVLPGPGISAAFERTLDSLLSGSHSEKLPVSITFDVSRLLVPSELERVVALRIAPRPPIDAAHEYAGETAARHCDKVEHITGGFTKEGDEIAALDLKQVRSIALEEPPGRRYVVTGVGSSVNPVHEVEASRVLFNEAKPASVNHSHSYHNSSFAIRERTAVINSALLSSGERIVTSLAKVVAKHAPQARLHVMTNDGGAVPLSALAVKPVHSMLSTGAAELVGAAVLAGVDDGWIVIERDDGAVLGEMTGGTPTVTSRSRLGSAELIATRAAQLMPNRDGLIGDWMGVPTVVRTGADSRGLAADASGIAAEVDLAALGAACAPVVEWLERDVKIRSEAEKDQVLAASEAKVRVRLVSNGVPPSLVRILEARVIGASYENSNTVALRVRGVGGLLPSEMLARRTS
ncbi:MAG: hypothetical protein LCH36_03085 [Actinobacteria bacterium]|jgi:hypothetical protein|nr:hypothetical protein [Actinomycetota bacterium]